MTAAMSRVETGRRYHPLAAAEAHASSDRHNYLKLHVVFVARSLHGSVHQEPYGDSKATLQRHLRPLSRRPSSCSFAQDQGRSKAAAVAASCVSGHFGGASRKRPLLHLPGLGRVVFRDWVMLWKASRTRPSFQARELFGPLRPEQI